MADWHKVIDPARLRDWMDGQALGSDEIENAALLAGGTQNFLLKFDRAGRSYVLRRPPQHLRANSNETMRREARVLAALADTKVAHPHFIAGCPDDDVIGAAFYLMEPVSGFNATTGLPQFHAADPEVRRRMGFSLVECLAELGTVDYRAVGLEGFGKPDGFLERQVPRWQSQLESYSALKGWPGPAAIPGIDTTARWLVDNRPKNFTPGILHGDYHLSNVMFRFDSPELAAIVDWELATIGDPLLDLGWLMATWPDEAGGGSGSVGVTPWDGFPTIEELIAHYTQRTTRSMDAIAWYGVMACFKLGIILEGTHARACAGKAPKETGDALHATTLGLFERAGRMIAQA